MCKPLEDIREALLKLDDRVLEIDLAHSNMAESLLNALAVAREINTKASKKWLLAVHSHKKLGSEIRQLLCDLNAIKHQMNASIQSAAPQCERVDSKKQ
jgi:hypothetical protein